MTSKILSNVKAGGYGSGFACRKKTNTCNHTNNSRNNACIILSDSALRATPYGAHEGWHGWSSKDSGFRMQGSLGFRI